MKEESILQPVVTMFLLTGVVWAVMYVRRLSFIVRNNIDPESIATPELLNAKLPANINNSSNNLKNLFELPVVFYTLCAFLLLLRRVDDIYLYSAWSYVGLRAIHSLIQCTVNIVNLRFIAYFLSSLVLWVMVARLAIAAF
jgi:hypothetical protein